MAIRVQPLRPGESDDPEVNAILDQAREGWWKDTNMFGIIGRRPALLKKIVPIFQELFGSGRIEPELLELMRLKTGEMNQCTYCMTVRSVGTREAIAPKESAVFGDIDERKLSRREALGVRLAEYVAGDPNFIPEPFFEELRTEFSDDDIVELVFACGIFNWGNKFNVTMRMDSNGEGGYPTGMQDPAATVRAEASAS